MGSSTQPTRIAKREDCEEVADLLERFLVESGEPSLGPGILVARVRHHIARNLSGFVLAGPRRVGVAQLQFREYVGFTNFEKTGRPETQMLYYQRKL